MLEKTFGEVFYRFKDHFYRQAFSKRTDQSEPLTASESLTVEVIHTLGEPTIGEFAKYIHISLPNATYRINSLVKKGYIRKVHSESDRREIRLRLTDRFYHYYNLSSNYVHKVLDKIKDKMSESECLQFIQSLNVMLNVMDECENEETGKSIPPA